MDQGDYDLPSSVCFPRDFAAFPHVRSWLIMASRWLFGLLLWSALERLKAQIAAKKAEDAMDLEALSEKDLWCRDLDVLVEEWEVQLRSRCRDLDKRFAEPRAVSLKKIGAGGGKGSSRVKTTMNMHRRRRPRPREPRCPRSRPKTAQRFAGMFSGRPKQPKSSAWMAS